MFIQQVSVFLENKPGTLRELTSLLATGGINIREMTIADTSSYGIVRMILKSSDIARAGELLKSAGYTCKVNRVICVRIEDRPSGLCDLLTVLDREGLSLEYMYSYRRTGGRVLMILRLSDSDKGVAVLGEYGVQMCSQEEADSL